MKKDKYTQAHILASEAFANLATILGRSIQVSAFLLHNPDYKPREEIIIMPSPADPAADPVEDEPWEPASTEPAKPAPGQIHSVAPSIDGQIEQVTCLYDPLLVELLGDVALYDMFRLATAQFNYEMKTDDPKQVLSLSDKKKIAISWFIVKRAFVINHYEEVMYILNLPDVIMGSIVYKEPMQSKRITEQDAEDIIAACQLCRELVENNVPLEVLIENALKELEREEKASQFPIIPPLGSVPNGDPLNWLYRVINSKGGRLVDQSKGNRHEAITTQRKGKALRFVRENKQTGTTAIVQIDQADKYLSKNKTFAKTLLFTLQKMNAQNFPLEVGFSLQELVDLGMYSTTSNAARAIKEFFAQQKQTQLSGIVKKGRKTIKEEGGVLFYHYKLENGYVKLSVNENFNMEFIANYFTVFPRFAYSLSNNAFNLVRYIFSIARQNASRIKDKGSFTISLDSVRENLGFPAPEEVKNRRYKQLIIEPIEAAIEEIEVALMNAPEAQNYAFTITPYGTDTTNINQWLAGYLEIGLKGDFAESFIKMATKAEAKREKWEKVKTAELAKLAAKKEAKEEAE